jgi:hypothetical protein
MDHSTIKRTFTLEHNTNEAEFKATIWKMFVDADVNNDGVLEIEEFKQFALNMLEALSSHPLGKVKEDVMSLF